MRPEYFAMAQSMVGFYGLSLIPVKPDKTPYISWKKYQSQLPTPEELYDWETYYPDCLYAVVTGGISNLAIVDADNEAGKAWVEANLPKTPVWDDSLHGGRHYYYFAKTCGGNKTRILGKGNNDPWVDTREEGGYCVILDPQGTDQWAQMPDYPLALIEKAAAEYKARQSVPAREQEARPEIAPADPVPVRSNGNLSGLNLSSSAIRTDSGDMAAALAHRLAELCNTIAGTPEGARHDTILAAARTAGGLIAGMGLSEADARQQLAEAAAFCGYPESAAARDIDDGIAHGKLSPLTSLTSAEWRAEHGSTSQACTDSGEAQPQPISDDAVNCTQLIRDDDAAEKQAPYPADAFGQWESLLRDIATAKDVPLSTVGTSFLAVISLLAQRHIYISTRQHPVTLPSLYLMTIQPSGSGKTEVDQLLMQPVNKWERDRYNEWAAQAKWYKDAIEIWQAEYDKLKKQNFNTDIERRAAIEEKIEQRPQEPKMERLIFDDPTWEGTFNFLRQNPSGGLFADNGGTVFGGHGMNNDNLLKFISHFSSVWSKGMIDRARADSIEKYYDRRLCAHIMIQPVVSDAVLNNKLMTQEGFLGRFLIQWPETKARNPPDCNPYTLQSVKAYYNRAEYILDMEAVTTDDNADTDGVKAHPIKLTQAAEEAYNRARYQYEILAHEKDGEYSDDEMQPHTLRTVEIALRIAGDLAFFNDPQCAYIDEHYFQAGLRIARFYLDDMRRIREVKSSSTIRNNADKLYAFMRDRGLEYINITYIQRYGPGAVRSREIAEQALQILIDRGLLSELPPGAEILLPLRKGKGQTEPVQMAKSKVTRTSRAWRLIPPTTEK